MGGRSGNVWAVVVIVVTAIAAVVVLAVTDSATAELMMVISSAVVPTVSILLVGHRLEAHVQDVRKEVNGRFSEALRKIPDQPDRSGGQ